MKRPNLPTALMAVATLALLIHGAKDAAAQESPAPAAPATAAAAPSGEAMHFPPGVEDVLKLSRAKISDDITVAFIQNSGHRFNLTASEIVYLRKEGVSDRLLAAMLNQQSRSAATATPAAPQPAAPAPASSPNVGNAQSIVSSPPQPTVVYQTAPAYAPAQTETVYVVQDSAPYYYGSYPYYGYGYPAFSVGFGFGTGCGYGYGGYYGGYGGYYYGNGYRGGGYYCGNGYNGGYYRRGGYPVYGGNNGAYYRGGSPGGAVNAGGGQARSSPIVRSPGGSNRGGGSFSGATRASYSGMAPRGGGGGGGGRHR